MRLVRNCCYASGIPSQTHAKVAAAALQVPSASVPEPTLTYRILHVRRAPISSILGFPLLGTYRILHVCSAPIS